MFILTFEARQRQQVVDEVLHTNGLLLHQQEVFVQHFLIELFTSEDHIEKACNHGQRRAQFVADVGYEIFAHRVDAALLGDITRDNNKVSFIGNYR